MSLHPHLIVYIYLVNGMCWRNHGVCYVLQVLREVMQELSPSVKECQSQIRNADREWRWRPRNCWDLLVEGDSGRGVRQVYPFPKRPHEAITVMCDHTIDDGGWTVFQHRTNLSIRENFYRPWDDYVEGFGNIRGEYWMGLDLLHDFLRWPSLELRIDLVDYEGEHRWAKYSNFYVGPTQDHYRLKVSG